MRKEAIDRGYVYLVSGPARYLDEARVSMESLRSVDSRAHITVLTPRPEVVESLAELCDHAVLVDDGPLEGTSWKHQLLLRSLYLFDESPYDRTLFLDTDTYFLESCRELFALLDHYDVAVAHGTNDRNRVLVDGSCLPGCTPYNMGVLLFRKNPSTREFFRRWFRAHSDHIETMPFSQPPAMEALTESGCTVYVFQNNWNARFVYPEKYAGRVRLLHGRAEDLAAIGAAINESSGPRVWLPRLGRCLRADMPARGIVQALAHWGAALGRKGVARAGRTLSRSAPET